MSSIDLDTLKQKAEKGDAEAQTALGTAYAEGHDVPRDWATAVAWICRAAEQRFAPAQKRLGEMYARGEGVVKDEAEAAKWMQKSSDGSPAQGAATPEPSVDDILKGIEDIIGPSDEVDKILKKVKSILEEE